MLYVLSGSRRETAQWAKKHGIPLRTARHVYDAQTLPARTGKNRIVELPGFASRRDRFSILARLKLAKAKVEKIDPDEPFTLALMPRDDMVEAAEALGAEFVDLTEESEETPAGPTVTITPTTEEPPASHVELVNRFLPSGFTQVTNETGEPEVVMSEEMADELSSMLGLTPENEVHEEPTEETPTAEPQPEPEQEAPSAETTVTEPAEVTESVTETESEEAKPKRTRRTKVQMAYDAALADWEGNGGSLEAVLVARDALAAKHPEDERLLTAPQSDAEVEAQAEDDDALDF